MTTTCHLPLKGAEVALIEHPRNPTADAALARILALGAGVTLVLPGAVARWQRRDLRVVVSRTDSEDALCAALSTLPRRPDAVLSFSHHLCAMAGRVAERLRVCGFDPMSLQALSDKREVRQRTVDEPSAVDYWAVSVNEDLLARSAEFTYPLVVKPTGETSSTNVLRVRSPREFVDAAERVRQIRLTRKGTTLDGTVLVEALCEGPEYSVELTSGPRQTSCLGVTEKLPLGSHPFIEQADTFPAVGREAGAIAMAAVSVLQTFPAYIGPAHVELRATPGGPKLIEVNGRQPGGFVADLVRWTTGRDIFTEAICTLLGVESRREEPVAGGATWWQVYAPQAGVVTACGIPRRALDGSVRFASMRCRVGDVVKSATDNHGRVGDLVVVGDDPAESLSRAREIASLIRLDIA